MYIHIEQYTHTYMHAYIRTYIRTYIHTQREKREISILTHTSMPRAVSIPRACLGAHVHGGASEWGGRQRRRLRGMGGAGRSPAPPAGRLAARLRAAAAACQRKHGDSMEAYTTTDADARAYACGKVGRCVCVRARAHVRM